MQRAGSVLLNNFKSAFGGVCKFLAGSGQVLFCGVSPRGNQRLRSLLLHCVQSSVLYVVHD